MSQLVIKQAAMQFRALLRIYRPFGLIRQTHLFRRICKSSEIILLVRLVRREARHRKSINKL